MFLFLCHYSLPSVFSHQISHLYELLYPLTQFISLVSRFPYFPMLSFPFFVCQSICIHSRLQVKRIVEDISLPFGFTMLEFLQISFMYFSDFHAAFSLQFFCVLCPFTFYTCVRLAAEKIPSFLSWVLDFLRIWSLAFYFPRPILPLLLQLGMFTFTVFMRDSKVFQRHFPRSYWVLD